MPCLKRSPKIHKNKGEAHNQSTHRHTFPDENNSVKIRVMKHIGGQDQHHRCGCNTYQKGEVGNIKAPAYNVGHTGHGETVSGLK